MPSQPKLRAVDASSGVSALARTLSVRISSTHSISLPKSPVSSGWIFGTSPFITWPVEPSMVIVSPSFSTVLPAVSVFAA